MRRLIPVVLAAFAAFGCSSTSSSEPVKAQPTTATAFITALKQIEPSLVENPEKAASRARNICQEIKAGKEPDIIVSNTAGRFNVSKEIASRIVEAVRTTACT